MEQSIDTWPTFIWYSGFIVLALNIVLTILAIRRGSRLIIANLILAAIPLLIGVMGTLYGTQDVERLLAETSSVMGSEELRETGRAIGMMRTFTGLSFTINLFVLFAVVDALVFFVRSRAATGKHATR